ncbi:MAG TPA: hypothetical protein VF884_09595 [Nitrososphaeraceae archaeon]
MNTEQMETLLESVIKFFQTIEVLGKKKVITNEIVAYRKVQRVFIDLMQMGLEDLYQFRIYSSMVRELSVDR